jgi:transcriptional regulator with XRE-family HTH domain
MDRTGDKLRRIRERLKLTYRDVAKASREIAARRGSPEFVISLSRLAHIENAGRLPSVFRLYTLCAIYGLDLHEVLRWYGVPVESLATDSLRVELSETHSIQITPNGRPAGPQPVEAEVNLKKTIFLNQQSPHWGQVPLSFIERDHRQHRYGLIGSEDWSLFPVIRPGSLVIIDQCRRRVARGGWSNEYERPIYFLEHRGGFVCGWCALEGDRLVVQPHPSSDKPPQIFRYPEDVDVVGQVCGVAMLLGSEESASGSARSSPSTVSRSVK